VYSKILFIHSRETVRRDFRIETQFLIAEKSYGYKNGGENTLIHKRHMVSRQITHDTKNYMS
jgi:hypothetical protein